MWEKCYRFTSNCLPDGYLPPSPTPELVSFSFGFFNPSPLPNQTFSWRTYIVCVDFRFGTPTPAPRIVKKNLLTGNFVETSAVYLKVTISFAVVPSPIYKCQSWTNFCSKLVQKVIHKTQSWIQLLILSFLAKLIKTKFAYVMGMAIVTLSAIMNYKKVTV